MDKPFYIQHKLKKFFICSANSLVILLNEENFNSSKSEKILNWSIPDYLDNTWSSYQAKKYSTNLGINSAGILAFDTQETSVPASNTTHSPQPAAS